MNEMIERADVMKVGTKTLTHMTADGSVNINVEAFKAIGAEVAESEDLVLVSSAAIALGMMATGLLVRPDMKTEMRKLQRLGNVGQRPLDTLWAQAIKDKVTASMLLSRRALEDPVLSQEAMEVLREHLLAGDKTVVNETHGISHDEIGFGSNDILGAWLARDMQKSALFGEVRLFLLTDVNGLYQDKDDPKTRIPVVEDTSDFRHLAFDTNSEHGIGGMMSKFDAVDIAKIAGVNTWIYNPADGHRERAVSGEIGTYFPAQSVAA